MGMEDVLAEGERRRADQARCRESALAATEAAVLMGCLARLEAERLPLLVLWEESVKWEEEARIEWIAGALTQPATEGGVSVMARLEATLPAQYYAVHRFDDQSPDGVFAPAYRIKLYHRIDLPACGCRVF